MGRCISPRSCNKMGEGTIHGVGPFPVDARDRWMFRPHEFLGWGRTEAIAA